VIIINSAIVKLLGVNMVLLGQLFLVLAGEVPLFDAPRARPHIAQHLLSLLTNPKIHEFGNQRRYC
jgi:hypothetical protein